MHPNSPQRDFALQIVHQLTQAGFLAYWAGGCVRDLLLGITPSDYDVATTATPEQVQQLFGYKKTLAVGASFGVIVVIGNKQAGQVEVATFRKEGTYTDGRRPDQVDYCNPQQDALRRDFTINAMFYDPLSETLHDFVGGQQDLAIGLIRAVGIPADRMAEDKLRMLRAIRFAARFDFQIESLTRSAIETMADQLTVVSWERIADEFRKMLRHPHRSKAIELSWQTGLLSVIIPEISRNTNRLQQTLALLAAQRHPSFELAMAILLNTLIEDPNPLPVIKSICHRFKLSNDETHSILWLTEHRHSLSAPESLPLYRLKRLLINPLAPLLLNWIQLTDEVHHQPPVAYLFCETYLRNTPLDRLDPPPLLTGNDLKQLGLTPGKQFSHILEFIRQHQLNETIDTRQAAIDLLHQQNWLPS